VDPYASPSQTVAARATATALLVTLLSLAVSRLGPTAGGMLAALPVVASMLAVFTHLRAGPHAVIEILGGTVVGMAGFVGFCEAVALTIRELGTAGAFALATTAALLLQAPLVAGPRGYPWARNSAGRSGEASANASFSPSASRSAA
jgi:hypothetical protein